MTHRKLRAPAFAATLALAVTAGCTGLNPGLAGALGASTIPNLQSPYGTILIAVLNTTTSPGVAARASLTVTKDNGGQVPLGLTALPFDPTSELDYVVAAQDCDVAAIQLLDVTYAGPSGPVVVPSDRPPLVTGVDINCGNVIAVTIRGTPPNIFIDMAVF